MLKRLGRLSQSAFDRTRSLLDRRRRTSDGPRVVPRDAHTLSRKMISRNALKVLDRLHEHGHTACLVGGGVRDALVDLRPKDFDVATDASPEAVRAIFRNSRIIGRRFRLVHVVFGRDVIEVATFRAAHDRGEGGETGASGRIVRDNVFGSIEEDAWRRDFSVNALYYNIADRSLIDYVGGLEDLEARVFRLIGDPAERCREDPVRVLRAARLAAKLEFAIEPTTLAAMRATAPALADTPPARLFEEVLKLFQGGYARRSFIALREHGLLGYLLPMLARRLDAGDAALESMLMHALDNTDRRVAIGKPVTPSYLLAFMLWPDVEARALALTGSGMPVDRAIADAADEVLAKQLRVVSIPRRFSGPMREIWQMQPRLEDEREPSVLTLLDDRRFRAAYDFLCLRATIEPRLEAVAAWWTGIQERAPDERTAALDEKPEPVGRWGRMSGDAPASPSAGEPRRRRRRGGRKRRGGATRDGASGSPGVDPAPIDTQAVDMASSDATPADSTPAHSTSADTTPSDTVSRGRAAASGDERPDDGSATAVSEGGPKRSRRGRGGRRRRKPGTTGGPGPTSNEP